LAEANGWFLARQFETEANADVHENTTAREILADFAGQQLDYFVTGYGTGGTISGVGRVLRRERPELKIVLTEPANAQLVGSGNPQQRGADGMPAASHPAFQPHPIQGWTPDFIPLVLQEAVDGRYYDELIPIAGDVGMRWAPRTCCQGRHSDRRFRRVDIRSRHAGCRKSRSWLGDPLHAPRHG
jgi:cysteine synthase A